LSAVHADLIVGFFFNGLRVITWGDTYGVVRKFVRLASSFLETALNEVARSPSKPTYLLVIFFNCEVLGTFLKTFFFQIFVQSFEPFFYFEHEKIPLETFFKKFSQRKS
jgi:hypothetical protein